MDKRILACEIAGWYGTVAVLLAYATVAWGWLPADSLIAVVLNLTGAIGIVVITSAKRTWQPFAVNAVWAVIAAVSLIKALS
jgi:uncharacterized YccA/Bax inhibitor family protein